MACTMVPSGREQDADGDSEYAGSATSPWRNSHNRNDAANGDCSIRAVVRCKIKIYSIGHSQSHESTSLHRVICSTTIWQLVPAGPARPAPASSPSVIASVVIINRYRDREGNCNYIYAIARPAGLAGSSLSSGSRSSWQVQGPRAEAAILCSGCACGCVVFVDTASPTGIALSPVPFVSPIHTVFEAVLHLRRVDVPCLTRRQVPVDHPLDPSLAPEVMRRDNAGTRRSTRLVAAVA